MSKMNLLLDESPIVFQPTLAKLIGLSEAIVLQTLQYYCNNKKCGKVVDGKRWIYNTYEEWQELAFPFWTPRSIAETFRILEKMGFVASEKFDKLNGMNRKYYTITDSAKTFLTTDKITHLEETSSWGGMRKKLPDGQEESSRSARARHIYSITENQTENRLRDGVAEKEDSGEVDSHEHGEGVTRVTPPTEPPERTEIPRETRSFALEEFITFWQAYPRKVAKHNARRAWEKHQPNLDEVLPALERAKQEWNNPKYIPHPATWINGRRWEDEVEEEQSEPSPLDGREEEFWTWLQSSRPWEKRRHASMVPQRFIAEFLEGEKTQDDKPFVFNNLKTKIEEEDDAENF